MLVGGALVNALAFSGSNWLFSRLRSSGLDEERKRRDKAVEQLYAAQAELSRKRTELLDWISEDLRRQGHAIQTFRDVDDAMREYSRVNGNKIDPLGPESIWLVGCFGFNGPLRQYFSLYRAVSQRGGEREEKG